ncbi:signal peptidase I [Cellulomonas iranensis]|uniref:signal peptidase I n=1 Tax=Cellulomonas iranensis TaxID=76862 RepID=UPI000B3C06F3|nr:signal peptidase I [Cellulomonas iranensis]
MPRVQLAAPAGTRRVLRAARTAAGWAVLGVVVLLLWPTNLGGCTSFTLVSGHSMEPTYRTGDIVVARCGVPQVGDVVIYRPAALDGARIIHRVIGGDPDGWRLQGDNNDAADPFTPTQDEVVGVEVLHGPRLGLAVGWAATPGVWASVLVLALALVVWPSAPRVRT